MIIREFDPWRSGMCTCGVKYSLNPYTGCDHCCLYCYITGYIKDAFICRPKPDLIKKIERELKRIDRNKVISMANSSDPYPQKERDLELMRKVLSLFVEQEIKFQIVTKSDIVARDIDLLKKAKCSVAVTITTMDESIAKKLEPGAPSPQKRVDALRKLKDNGIPVSVRIDPVIPGLTNPVQVLDEVTFVDHVTASTIKLRPDAVNRMLKKFPDATRQLQSFCTERVGNALYLPEKMRFELLGVLGKRCHEYGISFGSCREGYKSERSCDGTHLVGFRGGQNDREI